MRDLHEIDIVEISGDNTVQPLNLTAPKGKKFGSIVFTPGDRDLFVALTATHNSTCSAAAGTEIRQITLAGEVMEKRRIDGIWSVQSLVWENPDKIGYLTQCRLSRYRYGNFFCERYD